MAPGRALSNSPASRWILPVAIALFTIWVYWSGLRAWFVSDDWVWVGLRNQVQSFADLWPAIFRPTVHGTIRPWSDRVFFLVFRSLFDLNGFPYHAWIVATQIAAALVLMSVARRLTESTLGGFLAAILWTGNAVLVMAMSWACLYKDILLSCTLLVAFWCLLRYIETGRARYNLFQWLVFLFGFGVMETNVVYPALAIAYTFLCARRYLRQALALVIPSVLYLGANLLFVKKQAVGPYAMSFDHELPVRLFRYWLLTMQPGTRLDYPWYRMIVPAVLTIALVAYVVAHWRRGDRLPIFFLAWYVCALAPVLPLRGQFQPYYATLACAGVAMLGAHAVAVAWRTNRRTWRILAAALTLLFLIPSVQIARRESHGWRIRGLRAESLVDGVIDARAAYPDKTIVLDRVDPLVFWDTFRDGAFAAANLSDVYLAPGSAARIAPRPFNPPPADYELPLAAMRNADRIEVYDAGELPPRNITRAYFSRLPEIFGPPRRIDLRSPLVDDYLGGAWYPPEPGHRWMGKQATLRLAGPERAGQSLHVMAYCPPVVTAGGPVSLTVLVNGTPLASTNLRAGEVDSSYPLPEQWIGKPELEVGLQLSRTVRPAGETRDLGLPVVSVEIR